MELGRSLEPLEESARNELNRVKGCVSQVWIESSAKPSATGGTPLLHFRGDSDSLLVKGLVAIALAIFSDKPPADVLKSDATSVFRELGLEQHLTPQRSNGVRAMIERIRSDARNAA